MRALAALAVDPGGLGGLVLRARSGPVRTRFEEIVATIPTPARRIHPEITDTQLFGGTDIAATLAAGRLVRDSGLADHPALITLAMAERCPPGLAARLSQILDRQRGHAFILLDEGMDEEEQAPQSLVERLAFYIDLNETSWRDAPRRFPAPADIRAARVLLPQVQWSDDTIIALTALAARFGIDSSRAPLLALRTARALAALEGATDITPEIVSEAAALVFPHRATLQPAEAEDDAAQPDAPPTSDMDDNRADAGDTPDIPSEMLIEAVRALLPPDLLDRLSTRKGSTRAQSVQTGAGYRRKGLSRGRPLPSRPGRPDGRARIDVVATLRTAAPWQIIRRKSRPEAKGLVIRGEDLRFRRYEESTGRLLIFAVDASGSAAMARMAEAKGAVELLLADAYSRRDEVALITFRGKTAELSLPPTRSLVRAKRLLAGLPAGGGTPLASALMAAQALAAQCTSRGVEPALALLTDGRANVGLDGQGGRADAMLDSFRLSDLLRATALTSCVIDTALRPGQASRDLAERLGATYVPLPRGDATRISGAVQRALDR
jgi:magnesium chelatase subunit D